VKLSVKLLSGLTLIALVAVAVVGLSHSASAAVDAKVYVTNNASLLTTEGSGKPSTRTTATTVYGTYASEVTSGTSARDIVADSDYFTVTVIDADLNLTATVSSNGASVAKVGTAGGTITSTTYGADAWVQQTATTSQGYKLVGAGTDVTDVVGSGFNAAGEMVNVTLTSGTLHPIVGSASDVKVYYAHGNSAGSVVVTGISVDSIVYAGNAVAPPIVRLKLDFTHGHQSATTGDGAGSAGRFNITYPTSSAEVVTATIKSVVDTGGTSIVTLTETGRNTARYEGIVRVKERTTAIANTATGNYIVGTQAANGAAATKANASTIPATNGPITVSYVDAVTSGSAVNVARTATYSIDTTGPVPVITAPVSGSESQSRLPTFTGTITDAASGIDKSTFQLLIDRNIDQANANKVVDLRSLAQAKICGSTAIAFVNGVETINATSDRANTSCMAIGSVGTAASVSTALMTDGDQSATFTYTETVQLPALSVNVTPDHIVDYQARIADLAGNYGYSDSSATNTEAIDVTSGTNSAGRHGNQPHTVKIDQIIPTISSAETGTAVDTSGTNPADHATDSQSAVKVTFDGNLDAASIAASDFTVTLDGTTTALVPTEYTHYKASVWLTIDATIPSNDTPAVKVAGVIKDVAGNSTASGTANATDGLKPVLAYTLGSGTGTGTGDTETAALLTKDKMTITITSDEVLTAAPTVDVRDITAAGVGTITTYDDTPSVALTTKSWELIVAKSTSSTSGRNIQITGTDTAGNTGTAGDITTPFTKDYDLDLEVVTGTSTPANGGATTESRPFLTTDFSTDVSSLTVTKATHAVGSATATTVTDSLVADAASKVFFYQPADALEAGTHTYAVTVKDAAGNTATRTVTFTKSDRTDFVISLFAGWNTVSVPSNPVDTAVDTVLSNTGITQVVGYDATTPSQPWRIASKVDGGTFTSQTDPGVSTVTAGPGYWIETSDFEDQKVTLEGPAGPGDARPGLTTIPTGSGWNLVGVVDQSGTQTQKADNATSLTRPNQAGTQTAVTVNTYLNSVNYGRVYVFNTVASEFRELASSDAVKVGDGMWVFISPIAGSASGEGLPDIVP
jgi:hypothetical protein